MVDAARKNRLGYEKTIEDYCGTDEAAKEVGQRVWLRRWSRGGVPREVG